AGRGAGGAAGGGGPPGAGGEGGLLGAVFGALGGLGAVFFPPRGGFCEPPRRGLPPATAGPRRDHSAGASASRWLRNTPPRPSAGTADGLWSPSRTPAARPSTDSRCAARRAPRRGRAAAAATAVLPSAGILRSATARRSESTYRPARARRSAHAAASCSAPPPSTPPRRRPATCSGVVLHGGQEIQRSITCRIGSY